MKRLFGLLAMMAVVAGAEPLRVMTFNVRYPAKSDGENVWENRKDLLVAAVRAAGPDLIGTQELFHLQGEYLAAQAPEYKWFGVSRRGNQEDEYSAIFYKPSRLKLVESGNFWLSETPEKPGSVSWEMSLPRMVTWGLFETRDAAKRRFYFYNTHLAHRQQDTEARKKSVELILSRIAKLPGNVPVILTGDFNAPATTELHGVVEAAGLKDAWTNAPVRLGGENTFHGFTGKAERPRRIDWIFTREMRSLMAETMEQHSPEGKYPSDHFPILAVLDF